MVIARQLFSIRMLICSLGLSILTLSCSSDETKKVQELQIEVINTYPHDSSAYTQGLEFHNDQLIESTGLYGESSLRFVEPKTGKIVSEVEIPPAYFAEGITIHDNQIWQITWQEETLFSIPLDEFNETALTATPDLYQGEGWGLCHDGTTFVQSNGSEKLLFRNEMTFEQIRSITVKQGNEPIDKLNELECAKGFIWANVYQENIILKIDPISGMVVATINAEALLPQTKLSTGEVLNGIAYNKQNDTFWLTGKNWPTIYEVTFTEA